MIIIFDNCKLNELDDVVIWNNIAHSLKTEEKNGYPATQSNRIITVGSVDDRRPIDFSGLQPNEHIWVLGHGSRGGVFDFTKRTIAEVLTQAITIDAPVSNLQKISGVTITSCHGAEDGESPSSSSPSSSFTAPSKSSLFDLKCGLEKASMWSIPVRAFTGPSISAVTDDGQGGLMGTWTIRNSKTDIDKSTAIRNSDELWATLGGNDNGCPKHIDAGIKTRLTASITDPGSSSIPADPVARANWVSAESRDFYTEYYKLCKKAGIIETDQTRSAFDATSRPEPVSTPVSAPSASI